MGRRMCAFTLCTPWSTSPSATVCGSTVWLGPITQWLRLLSIWKIKWEVERGGGWRGWQNKMRPPEKKTCWAKHSSYNLNHKGGGWRTDVMAAAMLPLPWQGRRARQHSPTNSPHPHPPAPPPHPGSRVHQISLTEREKRRAVAKNKTRRRVFGRKRVWGVQWAFLWLQRHIVEKVKRCP